MFCCSISGGIMVFCNTKASEQSYVIQHNEMKYNIRTSKVESQRYSMIWHHVTWNNMLVEYSVAQCKETEHDRTEQKTTQINIMSQGQKQDNQIDCNIA